MTRKADDKLGKVFSFDTEKPGDNGAATAQRDETFSIPAFLRREAKAKEPETVPLWADDDFARIAATAEPPAPVDDESTSNPPEASGAPPEMEEEAPPVSSPVVQEENPPPSTVEMRPALEREPEIDVAVPMVAEISAAEAEPAQIPEREESAPSLRVEEPVQIETMADNGSTTAPAEIISVESVAAVAETAATHSEPVTRPQAESAEICIAPVAAPGDAVEKKTEPHLFFVKSRIGVSPPETAEWGFERREPRLGSIEPSGEMPMRALWRGEDFRADVPADDGDDGDDRRWRLGPALDARDIDTFDAPAAGDAEWEREEKGNPFRWVLLAIAVAAGGYAVAHQLDTGGSLTASLPLMKAQDHVAALAPSTAPAVPAAISTPPASAPAAPAIASETVSRFVPPAKTAPAASASKPTAIQKNEPQKKVARAEDTIRPRSEAPRETATPVTLAPGPQTLSTVPAVQTRGEAAATGELVLDVQQRLTRLGYANVPLNGRLDAGTRAAIMSFQRNSGLGMTGLIDPTLLDNLRHTSPVGMRLVKGPEAIAPR
ncbi:MAG TPA: peptidoglycan-binding protein [Parvibaculum sp.]|jgi:hypothetical protein